LVICGFSRSSEGKAVHGIVCSCGPATASVDREAHDLALPGAVGCIDGK
jgi:hypothetical protein